MSILIDIYSSFELTILYITSICDITEFYKWCNQQIMFGFYATLHHSLSITNSYFVLEVKINVLFRVILIFGKYTERSQAKTPPALE